MNARLQIQTIQGGWVDCQVKTWFELKELGYEFEYATPEGWIVMSRKGYFEVFRTNPKAEVSPK